MTFLPSLLNSDLARERTRLAARRGGDSRLVRPGRRGAAAESCVVERPMFGAERSPIPA
jgi:hypothetical protein